MKEYFSAINTNHFKASVHSSLATTYADQGHGDQFIAGHHAHIFTHLFTPYLPSTANLLIVSWRILEE